MTLACGIIRGICPFSGRHFKAHEYFHVAVLRDVPSNKSYKNL